jgi:Mce-associated membrane protein
VSRLALGVAAGLAVAVVVFALLADTTERVSGSPVPAGNPAELRLVTARDDALRAADHAATVLSSLDYRDAAGSLDRWQQVATGPLLDQLRTGRQSQITTVEQAKSVVEGHVLTAAISELDEGVGKAIVLVAMKSTVTRESQQPTDKTIRLKLTMTRTPDGWKLSQIGPVSTG